MTIWQVTPPGQVCSVTSPAARPPVKAPVWNQESAPVNQGREGTAPQGHSRDLPKRFFIFFLYHKFFWSERYSVCKLSRFRPQRWPLFPIQKSKPNTTGFSDTPPPRFFYAEFHALFLLLNQLSHKCVKKVLCKKGFNWNMYRTNLSKIFYWWRTPSLQVQRRELYRVCTGLRLPPRHLHKTRSGSYLVRSTRHVVR